MLPGCAEKEVEQISSRSQSKRNTPFHRNPTAQVPSKPTSTAKTPSPDHHNTTSHELSRFTAPHSHLSAPRADVGSISRIPKHQRIITKHEAQNSQAQDQIATANHISIHPSKSQQIPYLLYSRIRPAQSAQEATYIEPQYSIPLTTRTSPLNIPSESRSLPIPL